MPTKHLLEKLKGKDHLEELDRREHYIKIDLNDMVWEGMDWINLTKRGTSDRVLCT
jgi:hypothetical protein